VRAKEGFTTRDLGNMVVLFVKMHTCHLEIFSSPCRHFLNFFSISKIEGSHTRARARAHTHTHTHTHKKNAIRPGLPLPKY